MVGLGVADGVYGWKEQGIDSGVFSRQLMRHARDAIATGQSDPLKGERQRCPHVGEPATGSGWHKTSDGPGVEVAHGVPMAPAARLWPQLPQLLCALLYSNICSGYPWLCWIKC